MFEPWAWISCEKFSCRFVVVAAASLTDSDVFMLPKTTRTHCESSFIKISYNMILSVSCEMSNYFLLYTNFSRSYAHTHTHQSSLIPPECQTTYALHQTPGEMSTVDK